MALPVNTLAKYNTIGAATTLGWAKDDYAQEYMQRLQVRAHPILLAHKWKIKHLKEFYPRSARLLGLNVNKGDEVCVRFRAPGAKTTFLPFSEVLCTLLHEIAHCRYSRHDKYFWGLYSQLVMECEQLEVGMVSGNTEGTASRTFRFTGIHRLGGSGPLLRPSCSLSLRQLLADAAEKRLQQTRWGERDRCGCDDVAASSTLPSGGGWICPRCRNVNASTLTVCDFCSDAVDLNGGEQGWDCARCSFHNYCAFQRCEACNCTRLNLPNLSKFAVQHIRPLTTSTTDLAAYTLLGRVADLLDTILQEREWQVTCLDEFSPTTPSVMSHGEFTESGRAVVRVRLRSPSKASEFLPFVCVCTAVLHQLAHLIERHHGVEFCEAWVALLHCCLRTEQARGPDAVMSKENKESLLQFTSLLECMIKDEREDRNRSLTTSAMRFLFADCGNVVKRERCPEGNDVANERRQDGVDYSGSWACSRCQFFNPVGAFLYCEMCGTPRLFRIPCWERSVGSSEAPVIIDDEDDNEKGNFPCTNDDVMVIT
ncbi:hypothetical protein TraAM80_00841 [Trypanosoma rangeli]|uniref:Uncharacterized protein n=1 Tax=Trypanosoma rangeli TaxID=5698 RepID=A0A3R7LCA2_TRYRA|nr:uncharacterized protein TraAM80_00841 [Trypanosoma rangeli]RNF11514.1 hypothetical protein TraAM80_00841 [Trypanosoma rangeli]|eukprot:RNF11514.1 hypothetical protein TraAM80_00841 [Trypanosoma rangeli]